MIRARLLPLMGGIALLAAAPAFAQTETKPADMGAGGTVNAPGQHDSMQQGSMESHPMHHAMRHAMRSGKSDASQDSQVDQLNDQSYQAAQQGQAFTGAGNDSAAPANGSGTGGTHATGKM